MLTITNAAVLQAVNSKPPRTVRGAYLARNDLDARGRARLAADLIDGRVGLGPLTRVQITKLCRTNAVYVAEARDPDRSRRRRQAKLVRAWESIDPEARAQLCRVIGVERVWAALAQAIA